MSQENYSLPSITASDWPMVVATVGPDWRVIVDRDKKRYHAQRVGKCQGEKHWVAPAGHKKRALSDLIKSCGHIEGLADAVRGLPDNPCDFVGAGVERVADVRERFEANDYRRDDYERVIWTGGNMRLVVEPCGTVYRLQWIRIRYLENTEIVRHWRTLRSAASIQTIAEYFADVVYDVETDWGENSATLAQAEFFLANFPPLAQQGDWPALPPRPLTLSERG